MSYLEKASRKELEEYLDFWKYLDSFDRRIYVYHWQIGVSTGELGKIFGTTDVRDCYLDSCWNLSGKPINFPKSDSIQKRLDNIDNGWTKKVADLGILIGSEHTSYTKFAFNWMLRAILFGNGYEDKIEKTIYLPKEEYHKIEKSRNMQMALLKLDTPRLEQTVNLWLNKYKNSENN